jgi:hypothetical protein
MNLWGCNMTDTTPAPPGEKGKTSNKIKQRLIWLGVILAIIGAFEVGDLVMRIAHPSM